LFPTTVAIGLVVIIGCIFLAKEGIVGERTALFSVICEETEFGLMIALLKDCGEDVMILNGEFEDGEILIGVVFCWLRREDGITIIWGGFWDCIVHSFSQAFCFDILLP